MQTIQVKELVARSADRTEKERLESAAQEHGQERGGVSSLRQHDSSGSDLQPLAAESPRKRVLLLGCSIDRLVASMLCRNVSRIFQQRTFDNMTKQTGRDRECGVGGQRCICHRDDIQVEYVHHPGVGYYGNLSAPYFGKLHGTTEDIIKDAYAATKDQPPDIVVVDSSLWDLANWGSHDKHPALKKRISKWCDHDIPLLLQKVENLFGAEKTVFRTAPFVEKDRKIGRHFIWSKKNIKQMYACLESNIVGGKLFGRFQVIDFHKMFADALELTDNKKAMWMKDGYHTSPMVTKTYADAILALLGSDDRIVDADIDITTRKMAENGIIAPDDFDDEDM